MISTKPGVITILSIVVSVLNQAALASGTSSLALKNPLGTASSGAGQNTDTRQSGSELCI
jgi:hypothetical protein